MHVCDFPWNSACCMLNFSTPHDMYRYAHSLYSCSSHAPSRKRVWVWCGLRIWLSDAAEFLVIAKMVPLWCLWKLKLTSWFVFVCGHYVVIFRVLQYTVQTSWCIHLSCLFCNHVMSQYVRTWAHNLPSVIMHSSLVKLTLGSIRIEYNYSQYLWLWLTLFVFLIKHFIFQQNWNPCEWSTLCWQIFNWGASLRSF